MPLRDFKTREAFEGGSCTDETARTWAGLLLSAFTCDLYCKDGQPQTLRLALVMWLEGAESREDLQAFLSDVDKAQGTIPLRGNKHPHYDVIEVDRILGPEYIIPAFTQPGHEKYLKSRDFRKEPISEHEVWTTIALARKIGCAHPTTVHDDE